MREGAVRRGADDIEGGKFVLPGRARVVAAGDSDVTQNMSSERTA
jgi:hypothetical protein